MILTSKVSIAKHAEMEFLGLRGLSLFRTMPSDAFDTPAMQHLVRQFALLSEAFPNDLLKLAARLKSEKARIEMLTNLWDEQGQGNPANGHRTMLNRFLNAFLPEEQCETSAPATWQTRLFLNATHGIYANGSVAEACGSLFFVEMVTPWEFTQITKWLRQNTGLSDPEMQFWDDHVLHDGPHAVSLLDAFAEEGLEPPELLAGISQARALEEAFWRQF